jgi:predicted RNase H-like nuclease
MSPDLQKVVVEVHPEVCFWAVAGRRPMAHAKKIPEGFTECRDWLMRSLRVTVPDRFEARGLVRGAGPDDILDAIAAAWTAMRFAEGKASRLPTVPVTDSKGLRMEMVY